MSAPTSFGLTALALQRLVSLCESCPGRLVAIPVVSGHDTGNLESIIQNVLGQVDPGICIIVASTVGKNPDKEGRKLTRMVNTFQVDVTCNPLMQSTGPAAVDLLDSLMEHLHGQPLEETAENSDVPFDITRVFAVTAWNLIGQTRGEEGLLITYSLQLEATVRKQTRRRNS